MDNKKDKCIVCGKKTLYPTSTHIDDRLNYVEGAGQLCSKCWASTFIKKRKYENNY